MQALTGAATRRCTASFSTGVRRRDALLVPLVARFAIAFSTRPRSLHCPTSTSSLSRARRALRPLPSADLDRAYPYERLLLFSDAGAVLAYELPALPCKIADLWKEAQILSSFHHPNVVLFYGVVHDAPDGSLATMTEFMINGSLGQLLMKKDMYFLFNQ